MEKAAGKLCEHNNTLMEEVCQGMELAKLLGTHLHRASSTQAQDLLVRSILASYDKALKLLQCNSNGPVDPNSGSSESPPAGNSPTSDGSGSNKGHFHKHGSKKRKTLTQWTEHVRVCGEGGPEGPLPDGYSWRKYGQKDILGANFPRGYYRCSHRHVQGCLATKLVQRSDRDPSVLEITYRGRHTCSQAPRATARSLHSPPPARVVAKTAPYTDAEGNNQTMDRKQLPPHSPEIVIESEDGIFQPFSFPPEDRAAAQYVAGAAEIGGDFLSPAASGSDYFLVSGIGGGWNFPGSEWDLAASNSAPIAVAESPIGSLDFPLDPVVFDPNFSFDAPEFFTWK